MICDFVFKSFFKNYFDLSSSLKIKIIILELMDF